MRGRLIVIEGTDCSGKETQTDLLIDKLRNQKIIVEKFSFPNYTSPTGRIIGGPYLGKPHIGEGWFPEGAPNVDPKVSALFYAADRKYNIDKIEFLLKNGVDVILDRYVYSNMAHQGGKIDKKTDRVKLYEWLETLEFELLELPQADIKIFLHMPYEFSIKLKEGREEAADQHEKDPSHLKHAEEAYKELASKYNFITIECVKDGEIRSIEDINNELVSYVLKDIKSE